MPTKPEHSSWMRHLERSLGLLAAAIIFAMMAVTFVDVLGRYVFSSPLPGAYELTALGLGIAVFAALPLVTAEEGHVTVPLFERALLVGRRRHAQAAVVNLLSLGATAVLAWRLCLMALDLHAYNSLTTFLRVPLAPFALFMSMSALLAAAIHLILTVVHLRRIGDAGGGCV